MAEKAVLAPLVACSFFALYVALLHGRPQSEIYALKPAASAGIQYVAASGSDANDGLSSGTAKATVTAACTALPGGSPRTCGNGTIYIGTGSKVSGLCSGCGLWLMGPSDPNYAKPPVGWLNAPGSVHLVGIGGSSGVQNSPAGPVVDFLSNGAEPSKPALWVSGMGTNSFFYAEGLMFDGASAVRIGIDSNGNRSGPAAVSAVKFSRCDFNSHFGDTNVTNSPTIDVGANVLWLWIDHAGFNVTSAAPENTGNRAAVYVSADGGPASGLIHIEDVVVDGGGGLRFDAHEAGTGSFYVRNWMEEGTKHTQPVVEVLGTGVWSGYAENIGISDSGDNPPAVRIAPGNPPFYMTVMASAGAGFAVEGPATIINPANPNVGEVMDTSVGGTQLATVSPAAKNQFGEVAGHSFYQVDVQRRSFSPSFVRFPNTLNGQLSAGWQSPAAWSGATPTATVGRVTAPDGSSDAGRLTSTSDGPNGSQVKIASGKWNFDIGDYVYFGAWVQQGSTRGFYNGAALGLAFPYGAGPIWQAITGTNPSGNLAGSGGLWAAPLVQSDGNWQWIWGLGKVVGKPGSYGAWLAAVFRAANPINVYAPMLVQIPASSLALMPACTIGPPPDGLTESGNSMTIKTTSSCPVSVGQPFVISGAGVGRYDGPFVVSSAKPPDLFTAYNPVAGLPTSGQGVITPGNDSEVADWALNVSAYADNCAVGTICGLRGQKLEADSIQVGAALVTSGTGAPSGRCTTGMYLRTDGGVGSTLYVCENGAWKGK